MGNKRLAKTPLLYIQQPTISTPIAPMQHNYYTPKHNHEVSNHKSTKNKRTIPLKRNRSENPQDTYEEALEEEPSEEDAAENKFKDMTIKQKVYYFINRSEHAPSIRCQVKTNEKKFHGVITGFENDHVFIRVGRRSSSSEIPLSDIIDIRIIGF